MNLKLVKNYDMYHPSLRPVFIINIDINFAFFCQNVISCFCTRKLSTFKMKSLLILAVLLLANNVLSSLVKDGGYCNQLHGDYAGTYIEAATGILKNVFY